jgi:integrase
LRKILIKTGKRHIIPLTEPALKILKRWKSLGRRERFVFDLVQDSLNLDDDDALYKARNNAEKCLSQALTVVGEELGLKKLNFHMARHSFAVLALNGGLAMSVVSRLLGHGSTDVTEKVYAKFLPETLASEVEKIRVDILPEF